MKRLAEKSLKSATKGFDQGNLAAATIIAADPVKYPPGGLMQEWADRILTKAAVPEDSEAGPLFEGRAA